MNNVYTIHASGRILSVGDEWDSNALDADSPGLASEHVIGRSLWDFVSGIETQSYLNAIFFACRMDHQPFSMICRCDGPEHAQDFRFSVDPQPDDTLIVTLSDFTEAEGPATVVDLKDRVDTRRCSICCSFQLGENWIDPMTIPDRRFFASGFGVCPSCRQKAVDQKREDESRRNGQVLPFAKPDDNS